MRRTRANVALFILLAVSAAVAKDQPKAKQPPQTSLSFGAIQSILHRAISSMVLAASVISRTAL